MNLDDQLQAIERTLATLKALRPCAGCAYYSLYDLELGTNKAGYCGYSLMVSDGERSGDLCDDLHDAWKPVSVGEQSSILDPLGYAIGRRVLYQGMVVTICAPETADSSFDTWVNNAERGYKHGVDKDNLKPLPFGNV